MSIFKDILNKLLHRGDQQAQATTGVATGTPAGDTGALSRAQLQAASLPWALRLPKHSRRQAEQQERQARPCRLR